MGPFGPSGPSGDCSPGRARLGAGVFRGRPLERHEQAAVRALEAAVTLGRPRQQFLPERLPAVRAEDVVDRCLGFVGHCCDGSKGEVANSGLPRRPDSALLQLEEQVCRSTLGRVAWPQGRPAPGQAVMTDVIIQSCWGLTRRRGKAASRTPAARGCYASVRARPAPSRRRRAQRQRAPKARTPRRDTAWWDRPFEIE
jgi:hypothetical protein